MSKSGLGKSGSYRLRERWLAHDDERLERMAEKKYEKEKIKAYNDLVSTFDEWNKELDEVLNNNES